MGSNSNREPDPIDSWMEVTLVYNSALKEIGTKLEILNDEFQQVHRYNPIEHIKSRMKTSESIVKKLKKKGYESTIENMVEHVNDIAGIRVICSFTSDIYRVAEMIGNQNDIKVLSIKDYIKNGPGLDRALEDVAAIGYLGVEFFFITAGFFLMQRADREQDSEQPAGKAFQVVDDEM